MASDMFAITTARPTNVSMQYPFPPRHKVYTSSLSAKGGAWHASFDADYDGVSLICFSRQVVTAYHHHACSCTNLKCGCRSLFSQSQRLFGTCLHGRCSLVPARNQRASSIVHAHEPDRRSSTSTVYRRFGTAQCKTEASAGMKMKL
jgi:hypothetical protein